MATASLTVPTESNGRIYNYSGNIVSSSSTPRKVTSVSITWGDSYIGNYSDSNYRGYKLYFKINGTTFYTFTYTGSSRPSINKTGLNIAIPANSAIIFELSREPNNNVIHIRGSITVRIDYENVASHPVVTAGDLITAAQIQNLNYYKTGSNAGPAVGSLIQPYVIGSTGSRIDASTYNNA